MWTADEISPRPADGHEMAVCRSGVLRFLHVEGGILRTSARRRDPFSWGLVFGRSMA